MSLTAFGTQLTNDKDIGALEAGEKSKTKKCNIWTWNTEKLVSNLKKLRYIPESFVYEQVKDTVEEAISKSQITNI